MEMVNGYVFLDLTKSNVYQKALKVLESGKPVVVKDGSGAPYYVDTMNLIGTNIVITKGGKTITIASNNTITSVGDIQNHLYYAYILATDEDENSVYIFVNINTNRNDLTKDNLLSYLDSLVTFDFVCNGYDDISVVVLFSKNSDGYYVSLSSDSDVEITNLRIEEVTQLF